MRFGSAMASSSVSSSATSTPVLAAAAAIAPAPVSIPVPAHEQWKETLDRITREVDSIVQNSPIDELSTLDLSEVPAYTYEAPLTTTIHHHDDQSYTCQYSCAGSFASAAELGIHLLESHILQETFETDGMMSLETGSSLDICLDQSPLDSPLHGPLDTSMFVEYPGVSTTAITLKEPPIKLEDIDAFISEFVHDTTQEDYQIPEYTPPPPSSHHRGEHGIPEMRYQKTFGSLDGHRQTVRAQVALDEETMECFSQIRRCIKRLLVGPILSLWII